MGIAVKGSSKINKKFAAINQLMIIPQSKIPVNDLNAMNFFIMRNKIINRPNINAIPTMPDL